MYVWVFKEGWAKMTRDHGNHHEVCIYYAPVKRTEVMYEGGHIVKAEICRDKQPFSDHFGREAKRAKVGFSQA